MVTFMLNTVSCNISTQHKRVDETDPGSETIKCYQRDEEAFLHCIQISRSSNMKKEDFVAMKMTDQLNLVICCNFNRGFRF